MSTPIELTDSRSSETVARRRSRRNLVGVLLVVSIGVVFIVDCLTPRGVAVFPLYAVGVFGAFFISTNSRIGLVTAIMATVLLIVGHQVSETSREIQWNVDWWNRMIGVGVIWASWGLGRWFASLSEVAAIHEKQFRLLIDGVEDFAILMLRPTGEIMIWNLGAERLFGYRESEIIRQSLDQLLPPPSTDQGSQRDELHRAATLGRVEGEDWCVRKDGGRFWANYFIVSNFRRQRLNGFTMIVKDMTEQKKIIENLARSNADLEQFAYVASHDLQEPLRAISGCVQILQSRYQTHLDAKANELIRHTVEGSERMRTLINDLLAYSRVAMRNQQIEQVNCNDVIQKALQHLTGAIQQSGAVITIDELPTLRADPTQLAQLFQNLIGNAIKFKADRTPEIHVSAESRGDEWYFSVQDNGIGIEKDYSERIFGIFQRLHARKDYTGSGIGLSICKKIVERHGGRIWVDSEAGSGSVFCFTLPDKGANE